jgi:hypothetical protein
MIIQFLVAYLSPDRLCGDRWGMCVRSADKKYWMYAFIVEDNKRGKQADKWGDYRTKKETD